MRPNNSRKYQRMSPLQRDLHWLRVTERIKFRGLSPCSAVITSLSALNDGFTTAAATFHGGDDDGRRRRRPASTQKLVIPRTYQNATQRNAVLRVKRMLMYTERRKMADDNNTCDLIAAGAQTASDWRMLTAKAWAYRGVIKGFIPPKFCLALYLKWTGH